jgi:hypothetical protein
LANEKRARLSLLPSNPGQQLEKPCSNVEVAKKAPRGQSKTGC